MGYLPRHKYVYRFVPPDHNNLRLVREYVDFIELCELKYEARNGGLQDRVVLVFVAPPSTMA
jgi:hypothetical protein